jgi:hypothetical protein
VQTRLGLLFLETEEAARHLGVYTVFLVDHYAYYAEHLAVNEIGGCT